MSNCFGMQLLAKVTSSRYDENFVAARSILMGKRDIMTKKIVL